MVHRHSSKLQMETEQPAFSRQRRAGHLLRPHQGLLHPSFALTRRWQPPIASKRAPVRNICLRRISRFEPIIYSSTASNSRERLTSIYCLLLSSLLRTQLALVFQIQLSSRSDEKSFHLGGSTVNSATSISSRIPRVRPITAFHSRSTGW